MLLERRPRRVLDIGCGPGKLAYLLAPHVDWVDAVDLSAPMIEAARGDHRDDSNIRWIVSDIHKARLAKRYDLMVAGASIHWMDLDHLFLELAGRLAEGGRIAFADGDGAVNPPWGFEELELMKEVQIEISEERPPWVDQVRYPQRVKETIVEHPLFHKLTGAVLGPVAVSRSIDDYIEIMFSRQSFAEDCMPPAVANGFREDMRQLLEQHSEDGMVSYEIFTSVEIGTLQK